MNYYIVYESQRQGESSEERFGSWWEQLSYTFKFITSNRDYGRGVGRVELVPVPYDLEVGRSYCFVWAEYSAGDSFGTSTGNMEVIGIYDTIDKAQATKDALLKDYKEKPDVYFGKNLNFDDSLAQHRKDNSIIDADGIPVNTTTWKGYFESLEDVHIEMLPYMG